MFANTALEMNTPVAKMKQIPEASGANDLVDNVLFGSDLMSYFDNPANESELAARMKGVLWIDTSDGNTLRVFRPDEYNNTTPANPSVTPNFTYSISDESTAGQVTVSFNDDSTVKNATPTVYEWDFGSGFSSGGSGQNVQNTYTGDVGTTETVDVRMKLSYQPDADQPEQTTNAVTEQVEIEYPIADVYPPPKDPPPAPNPPYRLK
jgi:hypothetical protein